MQQKNIGKEDGEEFLPHKPQSVKEKEELEGRKAPQEQRDNPKGGEEKNFDEKDGSEQKHGLKK